ncbi:MerR family transcriptional regulator [Aureibacillus halotolerans]|uniref:DNA-binding transcriptional MerR regulator n=1 Tax=Aureibacillus halotolerans TaxID=1508390 RepID=A0A4V3D4I3_9BACI|nr:MerR family transcriptional regulator [Aureibacillus halotolerans]TDQ36377.1 DNA-binding transcriptional MerR regulator [Aureibacillus halotolerans]
MYSIHQVANLCDVTTHTLRFYDKEGLLPFVERNEAGNRVFSERDLGIVKFICCLRNTDMPIKEIKKYIELGVNGESTVELRKDIILAHRKEVIRQIDVLKKNLNLIELKVAFYDSYKVDFHNEH